MPGDEPHVFRVSSWPPEVGDALQRAVAERRARLLEMLTPKAVDRLLKAEREADMALVVGIGRHRRVGVTSIELR